jgi:hypothetical protein
MGVSVVDAGNSINKAKIARRERGGVELTAKSNDEKFGLGYRFASNTF